MSRLFGGREGVGVGKEQVGRLSPVSQCTRTGCEWLSYCVVRVVVNSLPGVSKEGGSVCRTSLLSSTCGMEFAKNRV